MLKHTARAASLPQAANPSALYGGHLVSLEEIALAKLYHPRWRFVGVKGLISPRSCPYHSKTPPAVNGSI